MFDPLVQTTHRGAKAGLPPLAPLLVVMIEVVLADLEIVTVSHLMFREMEERRAHQ